MWAEYRCCCALLPHCRTVICGVWSQTSDVCHTKFQNLNVSRLGLLSLPNPLKPGSLVLPLSLPNPLKQGVESRCNWSSADMRWSNYSWMINYYIAYHCAYSIRGLVVVNTTTGIQLSGESITNCSQMCCRISAATNLYEDSMSLWLSVCLPLSPFGHVDQISDLRWYKV